MKILLNSFKCNKCGDILISKFEHDFKTCSCGNLSIDGGNEYIRCIYGEKDFQDLSIVIKDEEDLLKEETKYL